MNEEKIKNVILNLVNKNIWLFVIVLIILLITCVFYWSKSEFPRVEKNTYQALFLTNNQVYFGNLKDYSSDYVILENIYYLQTTSNLQQDSQSQNVINLVKLGNELHGPEDMMFVPKDKIMFWENLKSGSPVVQKINETRI
jgi:hypothetical protein